jgi:hypothetical protein
VVLTILKNISQWEGLSHILWKKKGLKPPTSWGYLLFSYPYVGAEKNIGPFLGCATYTLWLFKIAMENEPNI